MNPTERLRIIGLAIDKLKSLAESGLDMDDAQWTAVLEFSRKVVGSDDLVAADVVSSNERLQQRALYMEHVRRWDRGIGKSAYEYFREHFRHARPANLPRAHEVRQANRKFYDALVVHQSRRGQSIGDLFLVDESARGGKLTKTLGFTPEVAVERIEKMRESARRHAAAKRTRRKAEPS